MAIQLFAIVKDGKIEPLQPIDLPEGTKLIITVGERPRSLKARLRQRFRIRKVCVSIAHSTKIERPREQVEAIAWSNLGLNSLNRSYADDEPEYGISQLKELNPSYERR